MFRVTRSTRSLWHVVAAVSGASGVALAAYGAHGFKPSAPYFDECFSRANQQQMYHTCLLAIAPLTRCGFSRFDRHARLFQGSLF